VYASPNSVYNITLADSSAHPTPSGIRYIFGYPTAHALVPIPLGIIDYACIVLFFTGVIVGGVYLVTIFTKPKPPSPMSQRQQVMTHLPREETSDAEKAYFSNIKSPFNGVHNHQQKKMNKVLKSRDTNVHKEQIDSYEERQVSYIYRYIHIIVQTFIYIHIFTYICIYP
jgi:hypothetical protein